MQNILSSYISQENERGRLCTKIHRDRSIFAALSSVTRVATIRFILYSSLFGYMIIVPQEENENFLR